MEQKPRKQIGGIDGFIVPAEKTVPKLRTLPQSYTPSLPAPTPEPPIRDNIPEQPEFPRYYSPYANKKAEPLRRAPKQKKWTLKRKALTSTLVILLIGFGIGSWYGARILGSLDNVFHGNVFSDVHALFSNTTLKGENQGRVNILLAGDSSDDPGHSGADLTDSIMIVSIDT